MSSISIHNRCTTSLVHIDLSIDGGENILEDNILFNLQVFTVMWAAGFDGSIYIYIKYVVYVKSSTVSFKILAL